MTNEYGNELDQNGYAPSLLQRVDDYCFMCQTGQHPFARHEIFHGANRQKSKRLGLWVHLCPTCHMNLHQKNAESDRRLKMIGQQVAMSTYGWTTDGFIKAFGKNYL